MTAGELNRSGDARPHDITSETVTDDFENTIKCEQIDKEKTNCGEKVSEETEVDHSLLSAETCISDLTESGKEKIDVIETVEVDKRKDDSIDKEAQSVKTKTDVIESSMNKIEEIHANGRSVIEMDLDEGTTNISQPETKLSDIMETDKTVNSNNLPISGDKAESTGEKQTERQTPCVMCLGILEEFTTEDFLHKVLVTIYAWYGSYPNYMDTF